MTIFCPEISYEQIRASTRRELVGLLEDLQQIAADTSNQTPVVSPQRKALVTAATPAEALAATPGREAAEAERHW